MNNTSGDSFRTFGEMLRYLRLREHLTQRELALAVGFSDAQITRLEKGQRSPDPDVVAARFIDALHLKSKPDEAAQLMQLARQASNAGLSADDEPTPQTTNISRPVRRHNLPASLTPLIGREADTAALRSLLHREEVRLVTVIGPPGVGKTRLVLQVAWDTVDDFQDGVWFVPLASVSDPQFIAASIIQSLDLRAQDLMPSAVLKWHLEDKQLLLLLDNIEQLLVEGKAVQTAQIIAELLTLASGVKILTTSRAASHITGEHLFELQPLLNAPSTTLFIQRAKAVMPSFELLDQDRNVVSDICRRLDGLPLAIELAAARIQMFEPAQLLARLTSRLNVLTKGVLDAPARQRTLSNTIEWSYNLLTADEKTFFRRLGVFTGGCTIDAAEQIAGAGLSTPAVDIIQSLADKSLIHLAHLKRSTRINILETLREYACAQLVATEEAIEIETQYAIFYTGLAEQFAQQPYQNPSISDGTYIFDLESGNIQSILQWAVKRHNAQIGSRLFIACRDYWRVKGRELEEWNYLHQFIAEPEPPDSVNPRAVANKNIAISGWYMGEITKAKQASQIAMAHIKATGDKLFIAQMLHHEGVVDWIHGDNVHAENLLKEGLKLFREMGDEFQTPMLLHDLAASQRDLGKYEMSTETFKESISSAKRVNHIFAEWAATNGYAELLLKAGENNQSAKHYQMAILISNRLRSSFCKNITLMGLGRLALAELDAEQAIFCLFKSETYFRELQHPDGLSWVTHHSGFAKFICGQKQDALKTLNEALELHDQLGRKLSAIEAIERHAWIAADTHQSYRAAVLLGAAETLRKQISAPFPLGEMKLQEKYLAQAHVDLDQASFGKAWAVGTAMSFEEAVQFALADGNVDSSIV